jgi:hypothetical protein
MGSPIPQNSAANTVIKIKQMPDSATSLSVLLRCSLLKQKPLFGVMLRQLFSQEHIVDAKGLILELDTRGQYVEDTRNGDSCLKTTTLLAAMMTAQVLYEVV